MDKKKKANKGLIDQIHERDDVGGYEKLTYEALHKTIENIMLEPDMTKWEVMTLTTGKMGFWNWARLMLEQYNHDVNLVRMFVRRFQFRTGYLYEISSEPYWDKDGNPLSKSES